MFMSTISYIKTGQKDFCLFISTISSSNPTVLSILSFKPYEKSVIKRFIQYVSLSLPRFLKDVFITPPLVLSEPSIVSIILISANLDGTNS